MTDTPKHKRLLLTYNGLDDPDTREVARVLEALKPFSSEEVLPGSIRVEGDISNITRIMPKLKHWDLSEEGILATNPPHRNIR
jgi:hypothetical protein